MPLMVSAWMTPGKGGDGAADFEAGLKAALAKGPMSIAQLGSAVKRPPSVPKLKKFIDDSKAFKIDSKMIVSLV